ncbi:MULTISPECIES: DUF4239 domain-containing protein [unclassified Streptomyces]|uniref:bestrophin-like domain n=1 Tax=unclassified Streptomyces TaxID=2593676 RepID=UPI000DC7ADEF|nr:MULTISPECIES: DUF4239 domain-containing protein [unclassified Streptomyces]AWZ08792.1 hypothetical protein DRB89_34360 [Streptomyces sp. ICC4]AWZ14211.1 hypothetical protein DRB96_20265 [Streptomyces sp. ICC1]
MVVVAVIAVIGAALIAVAAARLGHYLARHRGMPDAGPAVGTAAGVVFSFFILTLAFLMVSSAQDLAVARKGNYAEAGALIDLYLAADRMPAQTKAEVRGHSEKYAHMVIEREWPKMRDGQTDDETWAMVYGLYQLVAKIPADTPPKAVDDSRDAINRLLAQRRVRVADIQGGLPSIMVVTLIGAAALSVGFLVLIGWPKGIRGILGIAALGAVCGYGVWLVLQLNHAYASGVHVEPDAFHEALRRMAFVTSHGI